MVAPLFPPELTDNKGISQSVVSYIFAVFPLVALFTSPLLGKYISKIGRKLSFIIGVVLEAVGLFLLGIVVFLDPTMAIVSSVLSRAITGVAYSCICVSSFALVSSEFPENV
jgi:MFS family permease